MKRTLATTLTLALLTFLLFGIHTLTFAQENETAAADTTEQIQPEKEEKSILETFLWYFNEGGMLMYPLAAISILALAVIVERGIKLQNAKLLDGQLVENMQTNLEQGKFEVALGICEGGTVLVAQVLEAALKEFIHTKADIETALKECGQRELQVLRNNLAVLGTVARIAPLMGLLGTVMGMIGAFEVLSVAGVGKEAMASEIRVALITTATGLIIAIPTVIGHAFFKSKIRRIVAMFEAIFIDVIKSVKIGEKADPAAIKTDDKKAEDSKEDDGPEIAKDDDKKDKGEDSGA